MWAALCVLVLCWFYVFPGDRLPADKEIVEEVLRQGDAWHRNQTGIDLYRLVSGEGSGCRSGEVWGKDGGFHERAFRVNGRGLARGGGRRTTPSGPDCDYMTLFIPARRSPCGSHARMRLQLLHE